MTPLANRSVNRQSRIPVVGLEPRRHINDENVPPVSNTSRLLAPTKSSVARSRSPSPSPILLPVIPRSASITLGRGRLSAVTSHESLNASFARRQSLHRTSKTSLIDDGKSGVPKPPSKSVRRPVRPSRPSSPIAIPEDMQDRLPGTKTGVRKEEGTSLSPKRPVTRRGSATPDRTPITRSKSYSKLPRASVPNSPAIVSPVLGSLPTSFDSPHLVSPVCSVKAFNETSSLNISEDFNEYRPPRTSSLQTPEPWIQDMGLGIGLSSPGSSIAENQERKYLPAVHSFSRPRTQQMDRSQVSVMSLAIPEHTVSPDSEKLIASTTPKIVCRSPSLTSKPAAEEKILTFAGRRLGNSTDLATLDGSARSSKRKDCFIKPTTLDKVNLGLQDLPTRVPSPSEQNKLSPIRLLFGDKGSVSDDVFEYTRVKQLSGSLLSSSFVGSTLSISEEADLLLLGDEGACIPPSISQTSLAVPADTEFDLPSPSENGFHVSWPADFGFNTTDGPESPTVQSSPSVRPKAFSGVSDDSEHSVAEQNAKSFDQYYDVQLDTVCSDGGAVAGNQSRKEDITTTLSILEGTPDKADVLSSTAPKSVKRRFSAAKLPKTTSKDGTRDNVYTRNDRVPSYMLPTPASEARKNSTLAPPEIRRSTASTPNLNARRESRNAKAPTTPSLDKSRVPPPNRPAPVSELYGNLRSGRSTPTSAIPRSTTPIARPSTVSQQTASTPKSTSKSEAGCRASIGHIKIVRHTPQPIETSRDGTFPPARPRSESKGKSVLNNLKGLFSGKRDATPTQSSSGRRFSIGSRKSVSTEADILDVPAVPDLPALPVMPALPPVPALPAIPAVSAVPESWRKSTTKSILVKKDEDQSAQSQLQTKESCVLPRPRRKSDNPAKKDAAEEERPSLRRKASKHKFAATDSTQESESGRETRDTVALMEMGLTLRQEASKEDDLVRKERMASFAQVMLDTVTNAVEAERNMYTAMQAAEQAKMSYMMTQQSVQEMNKLVSTSRRLPLFKRKKRSDDNV